MILLFILLFLSTIEGHTRQCEAEGSCRHCGDGRYSFYRCEAQGSCFQGETCDDGFCCPNAPPLPPVHMQSESLLDDPCPDGSTWFRRCTSDTQCHQSKEMCAEGKCCAVCSVRRRAALDALPTADLYGVHIPQCERAGEMRGYRRKQCTAGTEICWCVNAFGRRVQGDENCEITKRRRQENLVLKAEKLREELAREQWKDRDAEKKSPQRIEPVEPSLQQLYNITYTDYGNTTNTPLSDVSVGGPVNPVCGPNEQWVACNSACQPSCDDLSTLPCPTVNCQPGCACLPGFVRQDASPNCPCVPRPMCASFDRKMQCLDVNRQYFSCGSACPISCATRTAPRCEERCVQGCFCRIPFVLEDANDPLNSRCILPAQCPLNSQAQYAQPSSNAPILPHPTLAVPSSSEHQSAFGRIQQNIPVPPLEIPAYPFSPITPQNKQCQDPLKNYLSCGSACPLGCDSASVTPICSLACVSACFCRSPYIPLDSTNPNSPCVLPAQCPKDSAKGSCSDPRKEWSECKGLYCARSCSNLDGTCPAGMCSAGCVCREPYVLAVPDDANSRCVLPSECEKKCEDPLKEYLNCGSACPLGCDNKNPKHCTPCAQGCFCKNGFAFRNSSDWRNSECVAFEHCEREMPGTTTTATTTTETPTTLAPEVTSATEESTEEPMTQSGETEFSLAPTNAKCPSTTTDVGGKACLFDSDCPSSQFCCRSLIRSLKAAPQRCTCEDPNAVYASCGSLCPQYCGQPSKPVCSSTCNPSCQCAQGFIRLRNEVNAPCVKEEDCPAAVSASVDATGPIALMRDITPTAPSKPLQEQIRANVATAHLVSVDGSTAGRFIFDQLTPENMRIRGSIIGLSPQPHAIVLHQYGDVTEGCRNIGPVYMTSQPQTSAILGDVVPLGGTIAEFTRLVDWPVDDVIGRSIAVYREGTSEWALRPEGQKPLACGTIGVTRV